MARRVKVAVVTDQEIRLLQEAAIVASGGTSGAPRPGCVQGSLGAATSAALYSSDGEPDPFVFAAYLLIYLARNHCFPDGNKRVAWLAFVDVLRTDLNVTVELPSAEIAAFVEEVAQGTVAVDLVLRFFGPHLRSC